MDEVVDEVGSHPSVALQPSIYIKRERKKKNNTYYIEVMCIAKRGYKIGLGFNLGNSNMDELWMKLWMKLGHILV
jgi:hypothetical protein